MCIYIYTYRHIYIIHIYTLYIHINKHIRGPSIYEKPRWAHGCRERWNPFPRRGGFSPVMSMEDGL